MHTTVTLYNAAQLKSTVYESLFIAHHQLQLFFSIAFGSVWLFGFGSKEI
jgi:hypothetical protein